MSLCSHHSFLFSFSRQGINYPVHVFSRPQKAYEPSKSSSFSFPQSCPCHSLTQHNSHHPHHSTPPTFHGSFSTFFLYFPHLKQNPNPYPTTLYSLFLTLPSHHSLSPVLFQFNCTPNMYALDISETQHRFRFQDHAKNPSFSSSLLDTIYRSIDEGDRTTTTNHMKLHAQTMLKNQTRLLVQEELTASAISRSKWKGSEKTVKSQVERKSKSRLHGHDHDHEVMFFSSTSSCSDSSSGLLSSSDTESLYGSRSRVSCFAPSRPKPSVTSASNEERVMKTKSRALKMYNHLKKVKQPISPGGKLSSFLNSLLGNAKKAKTLDEAKPKSGQESTCSSASSFSRSCLSKASPSSNKLRDGVKRTVRFYPVSVIVDEDCRPCGHKCLYEEDTTRVLAMSMPTAWKIGRNKNEEEEKIVDKSRRVEGAAREFLKGYHRSQNKSNLINLRDFPNVVEDDDTDDDDAASYSSSDLFELDHLSVMGNNRYREELPVYETTHVTTNRAIANGLI